MGLFTLAGAWVGPLFGPQAGGQRLLRLAIAVAGAALAAWMLARHGANALFTRPFGRSDAGRDLAAALFPAGAPLHVGFYNLRPVLALACLGTQLAALALLGPLLGWLRERPARFLFALGRRSLEAYVLHLTLLALLVVSFGLHPLRAAWQWGLVLTTIYGVSWAWCLFRESQKQRKLSG
jgi:peptidoglycan/LPS O-acetylase OafA/YrhL